MDYQLHHRVVVWLEEIKHSLIQSFDRKIIVEEKSGVSDLVTEMDKQTEAYLVGKIRQFYPDHRILGEEGLGDAIADTDGILWVIDPIDGTLNFVKAHNYFGVMIGIYKDGKPLAGYIYDIMHNDLYYGIVGDGAYLNHSPLQPLNISALNETLVVGNVETFAHNRYNMKALLNVALGARSYGSSALEFVSLIRGEASVYVSAGVQPWDFAAGFAICQAMGLKATRVDGSELDILVKQPAIFAHPAVHQEVLKLLSQK